MAPVNLQRPGIGPHRPLRGPGRGGMVQMILKQRERKLRPEAKAILKSFHVGKSFDSSPLALPPAGLSGFVLFQFGQAPGFAGRLALLLLGSIRIRPTHSHFT